MDLDLDLDSDSVCIYVHWQSWWAPFDLTRMTSSGICFCIVSFWYERRNPVLNFDADVDLISLTFHGLL